MKTPIWEPSPGSLVTWLLTQLQARPLDLWTITMVDGTVLRWTTGDWPCTINGLTWTLGPGITRGSIKRSIGVSVDSARMTLYGDDTVLVGNQPLLAAIAHRAFDGARVELFRAFFSDPSGRQWVNSLGASVEWVNSLGAGVQWSDPTPVCRGLISEFAGRWGAAKVSRVQAEVEVRSYAELLDVMVPSQIYQAGCRNGLGDALCGVAMASYTYTATVTSVDATRRIITCAGGAATGWGDLGSVTMTSGANAGVSRMIRTQTLAGSTLTITTTAPWPRAVAVGDAITWRAGCDRTRATCAAKFANLARYRGEPYVPEASTVT